jgi:cytochrome c553
MLKPNRLLMTAARVLALISVSSLAHAQRNWDAPPIVTTYCSGCHRVDGNSQLPYFPKLAGLDAKYAEKKLTAFKEPATPPVDELLAWTLKSITAKKDPVNVTHNERIDMEGVAHAAKADVIKEAVDWYAKQTPFRGHSSDKAAMVTGGNLFLHGVPEQKILACATCHGANAQGQGPAPRLAGQNAEYIEGQLDKFRKGDRRHAPEMTMVTRDLDREQAHAAAVFLQSR